MLALSGYSSSDEEDRKTEDRSKAAENALSESKAGEKSLPDFGSKTGANLKEDASTVMDGIEDSQTSALATKQPVGPSLGPTFPSDLAHDAEQSNTSAPSSPYSATRARIRSLTMPQVSNFDIPPSPPGSPPQSSTKKFAKFLELKRKGIHFNTKLDSSSAIRNPGVLPKLLEFAGIDHYDQYASALPEDLSIPTSYPPWAYGEELNKTQERLLKRKEADKAKSVRERVDFVSSSGTSSPRTGMKTGDGRQQYVRSGSPKHKRRRSKSR